MKVSKMTLQQLIDYRESLHSTVKMEQALLDGIISSILAAPGTCSSVTRDIMESYNKLIYAKHLELDRVTNLIERRA